MAFQVYKKPRRQKISPKKGAWNAFSKYIRLRDHNIHNRVYSGEARAALCITCKKLYPIEGFGSMQAGHFIPGRRNAYLFDEDQVNAQCYNCNINLKGNWPAYYEEMVSRHGKEKVDKMISRRSEIKKYSHKDLEEICETYKQKAKDLGI